MPITGNEEGRSWTRWSVWGPSSSEHSVRSLIGRTRSELEAPYKPSQFWMFILGFLRSPYPVSSPCNFSSFEWTIISLEAGGVLVKKWWGEKSLRDALSIQQPDVSPHFRKTDQSSYCFMNLFKICSTSTSRHFTSPISKKPTST